jgi:Tol biopolymer transport system component
MRELVFASDWAPDLAAGEVYVVPTSARGRVNLSNSPGIGEADATWSPDGKTIAFRRESDRLFTVPAGGGRPTLAVEGIEFSKWGPARWTPDGELSFVGSSDGRMALFRVGPGGTNLRLILENVTDPSWSPDGGRFAFVRQEPGGCPRYCPAFNVYVADADGRNVRRLTRNDAAQPRWVGAPVWSPDGRRLAYVQGHQVPVGCGSPGAVCSPARPPELRLVGADGSSDTKVLEAPQIAAPAWSSDGRQLLFRLGLQTIAVVRSDGSGVRTLGKGIGATWSPGGTTIAFVSGSRVVTVRADGSARNVVWSAASARFFGAPSWAPGGRRLVLASWVNRNDREIYRIREDGTRMRPLTRNAVPDRSPAVSPDGRLIAFERGWATRKRSVWIMRRDGTGQRRLGPGGSPAWSPDGRRLLLVRGPDVWVVRVRDGAARRLLRNGFDPAWSPDGRSVAFAGWGRERGASIYLFDVKTGRARRLTPGSSTVAGPAWSPDGRSIIFSAHGGVYVMRRDGSGRQAFVQPCGTNDCFLNALGPAWSPDGKRVALTELDDSESGGLHVLSAGGRVLMRYADGRARPLRHDEGYAVDPAWLPVPR